MAQLVPENVVRKIDSIGRITLPKGLRDRMYLTENAELELFTANIDGRQCICLSAPVDEGLEVQRAIDLLTSKGFVVGSEDDLK